MTRKAKPDKKLHEIQKYYSKDTFARMFAEKDDVLDSKGLVQLAKIVETSRETLMNSVMGDFKDDKKILKLTEDPVFEFIDDLVRRLHEANSRVIKNRVFEPKIKTTDIGENKIAHPNLLSGNLANNCYSRKHLHNDLFESYNTAKTKASLDKNRKYELRKFERAEFVASFVYNNLSSENEASEKLTFKQTIILGDKYEAIKRLAQTFNDSFTSLGKFRSTIDR